MKTLHFSALIDASPKVVWDTMLGPDTYQVWSSEFVEGSYFEGSWAQGQRIRFLAPDGRGITSVVAESRPYEFVSLKHLGSIENGVEDTESASVRSWAPSFENYTFVGAGASTEVKVDIDVTAEFEEYTQKTWPKALARLKAICERSGG